MATPHYVTQAAFLPADHPGHFSADCVVFVPFLNEITDNNITGAANAIRRYFANVADPDFNGYNDVKAELIRRVAEYTLCDSHFDMDVQGVKFSVYFSKAYA